MVWVWGAAQASAFPMPQLMLMGARVRTLCSKAVGTDTGVKNSGQIPILTPVSCVPFDHFAATLDSSLQRWSSKCGAWTGCIRITWDLIEMHTPGPTSDLLSQKLRAGRGNFSEPSR